MNPDFEFEFEQLEQIRQDIEDAEERAKAELEHDIRDEEDNQ